MTPLHLEMILHYHSRAVDWRNGDWSAPVVPEFMRDLVDWGLLVHNADYPSHGDMKMSPTEKLHVFVEHLCKLPLPVNEWRSPIEELNKDQP